MCCLYDRPQGTGPACSPAVTDLWFALAAFSAAFLSSTLARYLWHLRHKGYRGIPWLLVVAAVAQFYRASLFVARAVTGVSMGTWLTPVVWVPDFFLAVAMSLGLVVMRRLDTERDKAATLAERRLARLSDVE